MQLLSGGQAPPMIKTSASALDGKRRSVLVREKAFRWHSLQYFFLLFRAARAANGSSQARGRIGTVAAGLHHGHSNVGSELCL